jgi:hypothetical protein
MRLFGLIFFILSSVSSNPNREAWRLLIDNKPFAAKALFQKNTRHKNDKTAAEAFRGLSEVHGYIGDQFNASGYFFDSHLKDKDAALFCAGSMRLYFFSRNASGYKIKKGYKILKQLSKNYDMFSGQFQDLLLQRYVNDGKLEQAGKINRDMGSILCWKMIGPFDNTSNSGYHSIYPPEKEIDFSKIYPGKDANLARWHSLVSGGHDGWIFMDNHSTAFNSIFYLYCTVYSEKAREVLLAYGSSSSFKIFLNGHVVLADSVFRNTGVDSYIQKVTLRKGDNPLLLKLGHEQGNELIGIVNKSNFNIRFLDSSYKPLKDVRYSLNPSRYVGKAVDLKKLNPSPVLDSVVSVLREKLRKDEECLDAALLLMRFYIGMEYTNEAEILIEQYLKKYSQSALLNELYSEALLRGKKQIEGQAAIKAAYNLSPLNAAAWAGELELISNSEDPKKIVEFIKNSPGHLQTSVKAISYMMGANASLGQRTKALENLKTLETKHKLDYTAVMILAAFYLEQGKTDKSEKILLNYLKHHQNSSSLYQYWPICIFLIRKITRPWNISSNAVKSYRQVQMSSI